MPHDLACVACRCAACCLARDLAEHDGIDGLQVRRVGGQRQVDVVAVEVAVGRGAEVVLHVARALHVFGIGRIALEFARRSR